MGQTQRTEQAGRGRAWRTVYEDVRERIVTMALPPDAAIDRLELCARHGLSQSPVREALFELEREGLVVAYPQSRTVVTRIDIDRLKKEQFLRLAVECEVARTHATEDTAQTIAAVEEIFSEQTALVGDVAQINRFRQLDDTFHEMLFFGANQIELYQHIRARSGHMTRLRTLDLPSEGKMRMVVNDHALILDTIKRGDPTGAADAMRKHLSGTIERLLQLSEEHPDYFGGR